MAYYSGNASPMLSHSQITSPQIYPQQVPGTPQQQIQPGSITYTTSVGPDGNVVYHSFKAVPASYQTPQGVVSGIQWVPAEATSVVPVGAVPAGADFMASFNRSPPSSHRDSRASDLERDFRRMDLDGKRYDDRDYDRKTRDRDDRRDRDRDRGDRADYDRRDRDRGYDRDKGYDKAYDRRDRDRDRDYDRRDKDRDYDKRDRDYDKDYDRKDYGKDYERDSRYKDYDRKEREREKEREKEREYERVQDRIARSRRGSTYGSPVLPGSVPAGYPGSHTTSPVYGVTSSYATAPIPPGTVYPGAPGVRPGSPYQPGGPIAPRPVSPYQVGGVLPRPSSPYQPGGVVPGVISPRPSSPYHPAGRPASPYHPAGAIRPSSPYHPAGSIPVAPRPVSPYRTAGGLPPRAASPYHPGGQVRPSSPYRPSANTSPYPGAGVPVYPPGHVMEGKPIQGGISRAASPGPYGSQRASPVAYTTGMPPTMPGAYGAQPAGVTDKMLNEPEGFNRPPNAAQPYTPFDTMKIQDMDEFYEVIPRMPLVLLTHDVYHEDWIRFMTDLSLSWSGKLPVPDYAREGRQPRRTVLTADLIDLWNTSFFLKRGVEVVLYKGRERRSGANIGVVDVHLPGFEDYPQGDESEESDTEDSEDDDEFYDERQRYGAYGGVYGRQVEGQMHELQEARRIRREKKRAEKKRRRQERRHRRKLREAERKYALFLTYVSPRESGYV